MPVMVELMNDKWPPPVLLSVTTCAADGPAGTARGAKLSEVADRLATGTPSESDWLARHCPVFASRLVQNTARSMFHKRVGAVDVGAGERR